MPEPPASAERTAPPVYDQAPQEMIGLTRRIGGGEVIVLLPSGDWAGPERVDLERRLGGSTG